ncbi:MAG: methionine--tRNA ligase [Lentisphaeria bacterium]|nr:methionine--tRNA ligase [Lentisphaeria bacterium]
MSNNTFYVTTPIYYVNDKPHIGHAYTTVLADVLARYHRAAGDDVWFLTGTDEHGQKVEKAAAKNGMTPIEQCDSTVVRFQELWKRLGITNDDFIRTTEERHQKIVRAILQDLYDRDLIYKSEYKGYYCVPCERFFTEKDLVDGKLCPDCKREVETIVESNYFFRMSRYQDWLIKYITEHPDFIQPAFRANETLGFLRKPLEDLCISRPKARLSWGIELPFDSEYVCYVWFDALINYISAIGYGVDQARFERYWTSCIHLIGKDILTTHSVYWPTMLHAIGLPMPKTIFAHGWWLTKMMVDKQDGGTECVGTCKMSKSSRPGMHTKVVNPMDMADKYGVDAFRYFLLAAMTPGNDAVFSEEDFLQRFNSDLANDLGNLLSRVVKLSIKNFGGKLPAPPPLQPLEMELLSKAGLAVKQLENELNAMKLDRGIAAVMNVVREANKFLERTAPWTLAKEGKTDRLAAVLYTAAQTLEIVSGLLFPIMPEKMTLLRRSLGLSEEEIVKTDFQSLREFGNGEITRTMVDMPPLFPRILVEKKPEDAASAKPEKQKKQEIKAAKTKDVVVPEGMVTLEQFFRTQLRTAKVLEAERIEGKTRLLHLKVDLGNGDVRSLVAGIAQQYAPEDVIGRTIVVVANLMPAKIAGFESCGMLLAAKSENSLKLVTVDGGSDPGLSVG